MHHACPHAPPCAHRACGNRLCGGGRFRVSGVGIVSGFRGEGFRLSSNVRARIVANRGCAHRGCAHRGYIRSSWLYTHRTCAHRGCMGAFLAFAKRFRAFVGRASGFRGKGFSRGGLRAFVHGERMHSGCVHRGARLQLKHQAPAL